MSFATGVVVGLGLAAMVILFLIIKFTDIFNK